MLSVVLTLAANNLLCNFGYSAVNKSCGPSVLKLKVVTDPAWKIPLVPSLRQTAAIFGNNKWAFDLAKRMFGRPSPLRGRSLGLTRAISSFYFPQRLLAGQSRFGLFGLHTTPGLVLSKAGLKVRRA